MQPTNIDATAETVPITVPRNQSEARRVAAAAYEYRSYGQKLVTA
jgi:hypothetical protein